MTTSRDSTNLPSADVASFADGIRAKAQKLVAETELRLASPTEWAELLPQVRVGMRALSLDRLSFAQLGSDECAEVLDNLGRAADYLSTIGKVLDAAYAVVLDAMSREGEPLADLV